MASKESHSHGLRNHEVHQRDGVAAASHARAPTASQALTGRVSQAYLSNARWRTRLSEPMLLK